LGGTLGTRGKNFGVTIVSKITALVLGEGKNGAGLVIIFL